MVKRKGLPLLAFTLCLILFLIAPLFLTGCADEEPLTPPPSDGGNESPPPVEDTRLESLDALYLPDTFVLEAKVVAAQDGIPEYCRVRGYVLPSAYFEIRLPTSGWNKKFYFAGCGGFCGQVLADSLNESLSLGYAAATTDTGHWGESLVDNAWAYNNRQAEIEFGYLAVHKVTVAAKAIIEAYYSEAPAYSYFVGCSNGGRQALQEAQRYPEDFDGIISQSPGVRYSGLTLNNAWLVQANTDAQGQPIITADDAIVVYQAVYELCDGQDGNVDGIIDDPQKVSLNLNDLLDYGITSEQVAVLDKIYGGVKDSSGNVLYPGTPIGSEPGWPGMVCGSGGMPPAIIMLGMPHLSYVAFDTDPESITLYDVDFDTDPAKMTYTASILDATNPDLSGFEASGGKLIIIHGWGDSLATPYMSTEYYESVIAEMGSLERIQEFCLLYMVPAWGHCGPIAGLPAPTTVDWLTVLEDWVEDGIAPDGVAAVQLSTDGAVERTRTLYPYPEAPGITENAQ